MNISGLLPVYVVCIFFSTMQSSASLLVLGTVK